MTKLLPRLESSRRCVDVPREVCFSVRKPKRVRRPSIVLWCPEDKESHDDDDDEEEEEVVEDDDDKQELDSNNTILTRHTLLAVGGASRDEDVEGPQSTSLEVLNLRRTAAKGNARCTRPPPPPLPAALQGVAAVNLHGAPLVCGGYDVSSGVINRCGLYCHRKGQIVFLLALLEKYR